MNTTAAPQPGDYVSGQYQYNGGLRRTEGYVVRLVELGNETLVAITVKDSKVKRCLEGNTVRVIRQAA